IVLVGGAVRDAGLRRPSVDLDVAVRAGALALAGSVAARLDGTMVVLDAARGAARVIAGGHHLDVADFRAPTLEADLLARDFTVNALAVDLRALLREGRAPIIDPTGGLGVVLPEIEPMRGALQPAPHRFTVFEHSLRAVAGADRLLLRLAALRPFGDELAEHMAEPLGGGVERSRALKLAALLHDVSK